MSSDPPSTGSMNSDIQGIVLFAVGPALGLGIAYGASKIVDPVLIWGGTKCGSPGQFDIVACTGYPPTGLIFALMIGMVIAILSLGLVDQIINRVPT